ncbi:hypothetical protein EJB05_51369, partial [Eragrostis curvula]
MLAFGLVTMLAHAHGEVISKALQRTKYKQLASNTRTPLKFFSRQGGAGAQVGRYLAPPLLGATALSLIVFKAPGGVFLRLHGSAPGFVYYGTLIAVVIFGLAEASFGFWVVPRDIDGWRAAGKAVLWISIFLLVFVAALGGLAFLK